MLNFSKLKIALIIFACLISVYFAAPSFLVRGENSPFSKILPKQKVNLGLDLQGGSQLTLEVDFEYYLKEQILNLREEVKSAFRENNIQSLPQIDGSKIMVTILDEQKKEAKKIIRKINSEIDFNESEQGFEIEYSSQKIAEIKKNLIAQSIEIVRRRIDENGTKEPMIQAQGENRIILQVPGLQNSTELKAVLGKTAKMTFHFLDDSAFLAGSSYVSADVMMLSDKNGRIYPIKKDIVLSGDLLTDANVSYHENEPAVAFRFNEAGTRKFAQITRDNIGKIFAIVLDGEVVTAPRINTKIDQGSGVISGNFTTKEANDVALLLRAGALPAPLKIIEERTVGPSLGADSIKSGKISVIAGLGFVAAFMMIFYGLFGFVANVALVVNVAMIISFLALVGANLTLPGIAGIVLTMGMAVDANVLIFERIKEELREKKSNLVAIEQGFSQAFRTIVDSNITTLIVAFFLYLFGNGPVKGFAVTLSIGILASMFSATILVRMVIAIWIKKMRPKKLNLL